jgi:hypothetical protein
MKQTSVGAVVVAVSTLAFVAGCAPSNSDRRGSDAKVKASLLRGVAQIRGSHDAQRLHGQLVRTLARLRAERASTAAGRRAKSLAIRGFTSTLKGINSELAFIENDSGNIEAAVRDARREDRYLTQGANLLRAAGRVLSVRIGKLKAH